MFKSRLLIRPIFMRLSSCMVNYHSVSRYQCNQLLQKQCQPVFKLQTGIRFLLRDREREVSASVEASLKAQDKIPNDYYIVYRAPHEKYIKVAYSLAIVSCLVAPCLIASIYFTGHLHTYPIEFLDIPLFQSEKDVYLLLSMLLVTISNVAHTVAKYPFRIYRNPLENKYIAVYQHIVPTLVKRSQFKAGEVKQLNGWIWQDSLYRINKKKVILVHDHFFTPMELHRMTIDPNAKDPIEIQKRRSKMV